MLLQPLLWDALLQPFYLAVGHWTNRTRGARHGARPRSASSADEDAPLHSTAESVAEEEPGPGSKTMPGRLPVVAALISSALLLLLPQGRRRAMQCARCLLPALPCTGACDTGVVSARKRRRPASMRPSRLS